MLFLINVIILLFIYCLRCVKLRIVALMPDMASAVTWIPGIHGLDPRQNSMVAWIPDMGLADLQKNRFQPYSGQNSFKLPYA